MPTNPPSDEHDQFIADLLEACDEAWAKAVVRIREKADPITPAQRELLESLEKSVFSVGFASGALWLKNQK